MLAMYQPRPALPETGFVRLPQILSLIPISRSAWWAGIREGKFPQGIKLGSKTTQSGALRTFAISSNARADSGL